MSSIEQCRFCDRLFRSEIGEPYFPAYDDREPVDCPHCGRIVREIRTRGTAKSTALTPDEEARYLATKKAE